MLETNSLVQHPATDGSQLDGDVLTYSYTWKVNGCIHTTGQNLDTTSLSSGDSI